MFITSVRGTYKSEVQSVKKEIYIISQTTEGVVEFVEEFCSVLSARVQPSDLKFWLIHTGSLGTWNADGLQTSVESVCLHLAGAKDYVEIAEMCRDIMGKHCEDYLVMMNLDGPPVVDAVNTAVQLFSTLSDAGHSRDNIMFYTADYFDRECVVYPDGRVSPMMYKVFKALGCK